MLILPIPYQVTDGGMYRLLNPGATGIALDEIMRVYPYDLEEEGTQEEGLVYQANNT